MLAGWLADRFPEPREGIVVGVYAQHVEQAVRLNHELEHTDPGLAASAFGPCSPRRRKPSASRPVARRRALITPRALDLGTADRELRTETLIAPPRGTLVHLGRLDDPQAVTGGATLTVNPDSKAGGEVLTWLAVVARLGGDLKRPEPVRPGPAPPAGRGRPARPGHHAAAPGVERAAGRPSAGRPAEATAGGRPAPRRRPRGGARRDSALPRVVRFPGGRPRRAGGTSRPLRPCCPRPATRAARTWCVGILGFSHLQRGDIESAIEVAELLLERAHEREATRRASPATCTLLLSAAARPRARRPPARGGAGRVGSPTVRRARRCSPRAAPAGHGRPAPRATSRPRAPPTSCAASPSHLGWRTWAGSTGC